MIVSASFWLALGAMVCWGLGDFFIQKSVREIGDVEALAWIGIVGSLGLAPLMLFEGTGWLAPLPMILLVVIGLITFAAALLEFESFKQGKLSVVDVVLALELPAVLGLALLLLRERISFGQLGLMALVFGGTTLLVLAGRRRARRRGLFFEKGVGWALGGTALMAVVTFLTGFGSRLVSPIVVVWVPWVVYTLCCLLMIGYREGFWLFWRRAGRYYKLILAMGIFDTAAWLLFAFATRGGEISLTAGVTAAYPVIGVFLGRYYNRERVSGLQMRGAVMALTAAVLLALIS